MDVHIRGIRSEVWELIRIESVRRKMSVARLIEEMFMTYSWQTHGSDETRPAR